MYKIGKTYNFSAAHTIPGHPKCGHMHGHNYEVTFTLEGEHRNDEGMLVDYGEMDRLIEPAIEAMDHKYLAPPTNEWVEESLSIGEIYRLDPEWSTAECIAEHLWTMFFSVFAPLRLEVTVCETNKTFATFSSS